jgi:hypothetical protein
MSVPEPQTFAEARLSSARRIFSQLYFYKRTCSKLIFLLTLYLGADFTLAPCRSSEMNEELTEEIPT